MRLIALLIICGCAATSVGAAAVSRPSVRPASLDPVAVQGRFFAPRERVVVAVAVGDRAVRRTATDARGSFRLVFPHVRVGACRRYSIRAHGSTGDAAVFAPRTLPDCMPTGSP
jgi:hypothetical protein